MKATTPTRFNRHLGVKCVRVLALGGAALAAYEEPTYEKAAACISNCQGNYNNTNHDYYVFCRFAGKYGFRDCDTDGVTYCRVHADNPCDFSG